MSKGKLIVIEGIDGSGKTTQIELLKQYLASQGWSLQTISFPRYEDNIYGKLVKRYLEGEFGSINNVNPCLMALAYAGDRHLAKKQMNEWLEGGKLVLANRYVSSSKAHLGANLEDEKREEFMRWLDELEYEENKIPKEDLTILLNVDPKVGQKNLQIKNTPDIHENSLKHLEDANKIYLQLSQKEENWVVLECIENGQMKSAEKIHQGIVEIISANIPS